MNKTGSSFSFANVFTKFGKGNVISKKDEKIVIENKW